MNKSELVSAIAEGAQLSKAQAKAALDAAIEAVAAALAKDDKVTLVGFGTFSVAKKEERQGINPRTKQAIVIPARKAVKFKAGSELNDKVK
ncbi:MAG: HU family DNA-binding protein [Muribaculaceae bacterium]